MSSGGHSGISNGTFGAQGALDQAVSAAVAKSSEAGLSSSKKPIFSKSGHVTIESISGRAEFFLGKSAARIEHEMHRYGYETTRRASKHSS